MYYLMTFLRKDMAVLSNVFRAGRQQSRFKQIFITCFALGLLAGLWRMFLYGFASSPPNLYGHIADPASLFPVFLQLGRYAAGFQFDYRLYRFISRGGKSIADFIASAAWSAHSSSMAGNHTDLGLGVFFHDSAFHRRVCHA